MAQTKRMDWKRALSTALFVALLTLLAWYVYENREDMARLLALSAGDVLIAVGSVEAINKLDDLSVRG